MIDIGHFMRLLGRVIWMSVNSSLRKLRTMGNGFTPLHLAARYGYLNVCRLIIEKVEDKNPADSNGWTPLHWAAMTGQLDVCRLIINNVDNKHPVNNNRNTPKNLADLRGHIAVSQLFEPYIHAGFIRIGVKFN